MVQQLMREGNMRRRLRKASPMGLMASTTCRFSFTRSRKKLNMDSGVASILRPWGRRERERGIVYTTEGGGTGTAMQYTVRE